MVASRSGFKIADLWNLGKLSRSCEIGQGVVAAAGKLQKQWAIACVSKYNMPVPHMSLKPRAVQLDPLQDL
jgi:hypothetical protein